MFKNLFKRKKVVEEDVFELSEDDGIEIEGNTCELLESIHRDMSRAAAEAVGIDPDELDEEELDDFSELGLALYWMARGVHVTKEDLEQLEKTGHL
jgi:hypothetical protein